MREIDDELIFVLADLPIVGLSMGTINSII